MAKIIKDSDLDLLIDPDGPMTLFDGNRSAPTSSLRQGLPESAGARQVVKIYCHTAQSELLNFPLTPALSQREGVAKAHPWGVAQASPPAFFDAGEDACATFTTPSEGEGVKCANCAMWQYSRGLNDYGLSRSDSFTMTPKGSNRPAQGNALGGVGVWNRALKGRDIKARG